MAVRPPAAARLAVELPRGRGVLSFTASSVGYDQRVPGRHRAEEVISTVASLSRCSRSISGRGQGPFPASRLANGGDGKAGPGRVPMRDGERGGHQRRARGSCRRSRSSVSIGFIECVSAGLAGRRSRGPVSVRPSRLRDPLHALLAPIGNRFRRAVKAFADERGIPILQLKNPIGLAGTVALLPSVLSAASRPRAPVRSRCDRRLPGVPVGPFRPQPVGVGSAAAHRSDRAHCSWPASRAEAH